MNLKLGHLNFGLGRAGEFRTRKNRGVVGSGFTLIELLAVMAIIAIVAGLIIAGFRQVTPAKLKARGQAEMAALTTMLEMYKSKKGFYPSDKTLDIPVNSGNLTLPVALYYELTGKSNGCPVYVINSGEEGQNFARSLKDSQIQDVNFNGNPLHFLGIPYKGPDGDILGKDFAFWRYDNSSTNRHNPEGFDLWIVMRTGRDLITVKNWND
jgi:prepilin-type N-terminal cleavage/methylation domain-containing protein